MKIRNIIQSLPPSVKGGYCTLLMLFFTASLFSQSHDWEIGIGLRPLTLKEEPYSFIAKKFISRGVALRIGIGFTYNQYSQSTSYESPDTKYRLFYNYNQINKSIYANSFMGLQYGKKVKNVFVYGATDFILGYSIEKSNIPKGIFYTDVQLLPNQFIETAFLPNHKTTKIGFSQSIGIQFFINQSYSISVEGGYFYAHQRLITEDNKFSIQADNNSNLGFGYLSFAKTVFSNYSFKINPLTLLTFNYHF